MLREAGELAMEADVVEDGGERRGVDGDVEVDGSAAKVQLILHICKISAKFYR